MIRQILFISSLLTFINVNSQNNQNNGYFGKHFFISAFLAPQFPLIHYTDMMGMTTSYAYKNNQLTEKFRMLYLGYRISAGFAFKRNNSVIIEFGNNNFLTPIRPSNTGFMITENYLTSTNEKVLLYIYKHERIKVRSNYAMIKMEFAKKWALLPMGVTQQIGVGFSNSRFLNENYHFLATVNEDDKGSSKLYSYNDPTFKYKLVNWEQQSALNKIMIQYAINIRKPISKSLFLNYGIEYNLNFILNRTILDKTNDPFYYQNYTGFIEISDAYSTMNRFLSESILKFNLGIAYAF